MDRFIRSEALLGREGLEKLKRSTVVVSGLGGVGGYVLEMLARSAIGNFILIDYDRFNKSNLNRQIISLEHNIGELKTEEARKRILSINPGINADIYNVKIEKIDDLAFLDNYHIDYIVDAIDSVEGKIAIIKYAKKHSIPVISSMGAGNRLDPEKFTVCDINKTSVCPLAKKVRKRLREEGIEDLKVVYSPEIPIVHGYDFIGSVSFVPSAAGILAASAVIRDIVSIIDPNDPGGVRNDK
jgi:tRNA threonylcarbamoyladenosine dehydratase